MVKNKRGRRQKPTCREPELKLRNKYSILSDQPNSEKKSVLIGNSIVRNQCNTMELKPENNKKGRMLQGNQNKKHHINNKMHKLKSYEQFNDSASWIK